MKRLAIAIVLMMCSCVAFSQSTITGVITQYAGGLVSASTNSVVVNGQIDAQGNFSLQVPQNPSQHLMTFTPPQGTPFTPFSVTVTAPPGVTTNVTAQIAPHVPVVGTNLGIPNQPVIGTDAYGNAIPGTSSGGTLPTATAPGQIISSTAAGTTYAVQGQVFYSQASDTISSIESECSSACTYVVTIPQTFTLSTDHTLSSNVNLLFYADGLWTVNGAHTLTLSGNVQGSLNPHFAGSATLAGLTGEIPVEWFGAVGFTSMAAAAAGSDYTTQINKVLQSITAGQALFQCLSYNASSTLLINKSFIGIHGCNIGFNLTSPPVDSKVTTIVSNSASADILDIIAPSPPTQIVLGDLRNFNVQRMVIPTGTANGIYENYGQNFNMIAVSSADSINNFHFHGSGSGNSCNCFLTSSWGLGPVTGYTNTTKNGFYLDSEDGVANPSLFFQNDGVVESTGVGVNDRGFYIHGAQIRDLQLLNPGFVSVGTAIWLEATTCSGTFICGDIHIIGATIDLSNGTNGGIYVHNVKNDNGSAIEFVDGYLNATAACQFHLDNVSGLTISNYMIFDSTKSSTGTNICLNDVNTVQVSNNNIFSPDGVTSGAISLTSSSFATVISSNNLDAGNGGTNSTVGIVVASGSVANSIVGNLIKTFTTAGITEDGTTSLITSTGNTVISSANGIVVTSGAANSQSIGNNCYPTTIVCVLDPNESDSWVDNFSGSRPPIWTVSTLPSASTVQKGATFTVKDATTFTPGTCTGGGSDYMLAVSNGSTWSCH